MQGWHDDQLQDVEDISIPVLDRGFQYGEGLYETMLVKEGQIPLLNRHFSRLRNACDWLDLSCPAENKLKKAIDETINANTRNKEKGEDENTFVLKLILTGGIGDGLYRAEEQDPELILLPRPFPDHLREWKKKGGIARFVPSRGSTGSELARVKSISRLGPSLAIEQVRGEGNEFREAIFVDDNNHILQGARTNVFIRRDAAWYTPPVSEGLLPGVARQVILDQSESNMTFENVLHTSSLLDADALVVTNAVTGPVPVRSLVAPSLLRFDRSPLSFSVPEETVLDRIWRERIHPSG